MESIFATPDRVLVTLLLIIAMPVTVAGAEPPATVSSAPVQLGTAYVLQSEILGEERTINVHLPSSYEAGNDSYPVIYLLDGGVHEDYHHVSGLMQFLATYELMPPSILVGIANSDRFRDMTFPTELEELLERAPQAGGSANFRRFLEEELKPYVEANFRSGDRSTLIGQSLAGLFATEVFVETPELFDDFVIVSPSLWWDEYSLIPRIEESVRSHRETSGNLCILVGNEGDEMEGPAHRFAAAVAAHAPDGLKWKHIALPEENHATILHRALYRAIEAIYGETHPGMGN